MRGVAFLAASLGGIVGRASSRPRRHGKAERRNRVVNRPAPLALVGAPVLLTVYEVVAIAVWGMTLGKRFAGVRVLRADTLEAPGWRRAAIRTIALVPWCLPPRGFEHHALRRADGQPDHLAGTIVVDDRAWRSLQPATRREDTEARASAPQGGHDEY